MLINRLLTKLFQEHNQKIPRGGRGVIQVIIILTRKGGGSVIVIFVYSCINTSLDLPVAKYDFYVMRKSWALQKLFIITMLL